MRLRTRIALALRNAATLAAVAVALGLLTLPVYTAEAAEASKAAELLPVVCDEMSRLARDITPREVDRAKNQLKASVLMSRESASGRCEQLAQQLLTFGREIPAAEMLEKIAAVDAATLGGLAERLIASRPCLAALGPLGQTESFEQLAGRLN